MVYRIDKVIVVSSWKPFIIIRCGYRSSSLATFAGAHSKVVLGLRLGLHVGMSLLPPEDQSLPAGPIATKFLTIEIHN